MTADGTQAPHLLRHMLTCMRVVKGTASAAPGAADSTGRDCSRPRMKEHSSARMIAPMSSL